MTTIRLYYTLSILIILAILTSCDKIYDPINVRGKVVDVNSSDPVSNATVAIISPSDIARETISNENGEYLFEEVDIDSVIDLSIRVTKDGFSSETISILAAPERELVVPDLKIRNLQQPDQGGPIAGQTGGAAFIELISLSSQSIRITETAGNVNSAFTFEIQDSTGRAIGSQHAVDVEFRIVQGPGGGEAITPQVATTNDNGRVTSNIFAGKTAGNLKIEAKIERPDVGLTIVSKPILLTIHGGFPNLEHFSIAANIFNFEGYAINGVRNQITTIVGDAFSNPVKEGTPVYFNTTGGIIQGSGTTDADGTVEVDLISGDPRPPTGYATIRAHTFDENDVQLVREIPILFSGPPSNNTISVTPSTFNIPANGSQNFQMTITDINGHPLPYNTSIQVIPPEGMAVEGDVDIRVPNTLSPGQGVTEFSFSARDTDDTSNVSQDVTITISVETPRGYKATKTISGRKAKTF